jgi:hypothetical protein
VLKLYGRYCRSQWDALLLVLWSICALLKEITDSLFELIDSVIVRRETHLVSGDAIEGKILIYGIMGLL